MQLLWSRKVKHKTNPLYEDNPVVSTHTRLRRFVFFIYWKCFALSICCWGCCCQCDTSAQFMAPHWFCPSPTHQLACFAIDLYVCACFQWDKQTDFDWFIG